MSDTNSNSVPDFVEKAGEAAFKEADKRGWFKFVGAVFVVGCFLAGLGYAFKAYNEAIREASSPFVGKAVADKTLELNGQHQATLAPLLIEVSAYRAIFSTLPNQYRKQVERAIEAARE